MPADTKKFKDLFVSEAEDRLSDLSGSILEIEKNPQAVDKYAELMRSAHTIKGAAATMGYAQVANLAHALEDVFHAGERGAMFLTPEAITIALEGIDLLSVSLASIKNEDKEPESIGMVEKLHSILATHPEHPKPTEAPTIQSTVTVASTEIAIPKFKIPDSVKVGVGKLDVLMGIYEELLMLKLKLDTMLDPAEDSVRSLPDAELKQRMFFISEFRTMFNEFGRLLSEMQDEFLSIRLVPLEQIFGQFPRMIRDLSLREGKQVEFLMEGMDIELDRSVLDGLGGALAHLLRNAVDHGIQESGQILLKAERTKDRVRVTVQDNGGGIDYARVKEVAIERGVIRAEEAPLLSKHDVAQLIFHPNMTTNRVVTDISGRGIGLSAVKEFADGAGGHVVVVSPIPEENRGTRFTLDLPISVATLKVLLVQSEGYLFAIPFTNVVHTITIKEGEISRAAHQELLTYEERVIPLLRLDHVLGLYFGLPITPDPNEERVVVILSGEDEEIALVVDRCAGEQELLIKALPPVLRGTQGFSGSALIPDGRTILLLDVHGLLAQAMGDILESTLRYSAPNK
jgi:two-component system chemotaxis sensor kinase CheA